MDDLIKLKIILILLFFPSLAFSGGDSSVTVFTCPGKESPYDPRAEYNISVLRLALDKTVASYGPYELIVKDKTTTARALELTRDNHFPNFFSKQSATKARTEELGYVPFPVDLGIVGYRIFFVAPRSMEQLNAVKSLDDLKKLTIGQGLGWLDNRILEYNGFNVVTGSSYESLFKMVAKGRFDLFARGSNELYREYISHQYIKGLNYDKNFVLYYPLPRFFFTNNANQLAISRVYKGLQMAYKDGSLIKLWDKLYKESIDFADIKNRTIFNIENPYLTGMDDSYKQYLYVPQ